MKPKARFRSLVLMGIVATLVFAAHNPCQAQLQIISTLPIHGATEVDTSVTYVVVFSHPLDTARLFENGLFWNAQTAPTEFIGEPDSFAVGPNLKTLYVYQHLYPDTRYQSIITGAWSDDGQMLDRPYALTYTTGDTLPPESVSGTITYPDGDPWGTLVALLNVNPFGPMRKLALGKVLSSGASVQSTQEPEPLCATVVTSGDDSYRINYVPPGTWFPVAVKDIDFDGELDPVFDVMGIIDNNQDGMPDSIEVTEGAAVTGIDMTLGKLFELQTAREAFAQADSIAKDWAADAESFYLTSEEMEEDGSAWFWFYQFYSAAEDSHLSVEISRGVFEIIEDTEPCGESTDPLPANWADSDVATDSAFARGGEAFMHEHQESNFFADLGWGDPQNPFPFETNVALARVLPPEVRQRAVEKLQAKGPVARMATTDIQAMWRFYFFSEAGDFLIIMLDAVTAEFIGIFSLEPTTARGGYPAADNIAKDWSQDAALFYLGSFEVSQDGSAQFWGYQFYSPTLDSHLTIINMMGAAQIQEGDDPQGESVDPLPANWVDSDVAIDSAFANGGAEFAQAIDSFFLFVDLGWLDPANPFPEFGPNSALRETLPPQLYQRARETFQKRETISHGATNDIIAAWRFFFIGDSGDALLVLLDPETAELLDSVHFGPMTAQEGLPRAEAMAQDWAADAKLFYALSEYTQQGLDLAGRGSYWVYFFYSSTFDSVLSVVNEMGMPYINPEWVPDVHSMDPLPTNWVDSDVAVDSGLVHGGQDYLLQNPGALIGAEVGWFDLEHYVPPQARNLSGKTKSASHLQAAEPLQACPSNVLAGGPAQSAQAVWIVTFRRSYVHYVLVILDAVTAEFITSITAAPTTALARRAEADATAQTWKQDAYLISVGSSYTTIDPEGRCDTWYYYYVSPSTDTAMYYVFNNGIYRWDNQVVMPHWAAVPQECLDTDVTTAVADANGGSAFRQTHDDYYMSCMLVREVSELDPTRLVWRYTYDTWSGVDTLTVYVDALTGQIVTGVETDRDEPLPTTYRLYANYPNPFNASTIVTYDLPEKSKVDIAIYNVSGQRVRLLINAVKQAGTHRVLWDGKDDSGLDLPSGIYLVRINAGDFTANQKMVLCK